MDDRGGARLHTIARGALLQAQRAHDADGHTSPLTLSNGKAGTRGAFRRTTGWRGGAQRDLACLLTPAFTSEPKPWRWQR
ncbi:MAG: hypothetical protein ACPIOQ_56680, partial [Promethearchaeia archaeon]